MKNLCSMCFYWLILSHFKHSRRTKYKIFFNHDELTVLHSITFQDNNIQKFLNHGGMMHFGTFQGNKIHFFSNHDGLTVMHFVIFYWKKTQNFLQPWWTYYDTICNILGEQNEKILQPWRTNRDAFCNILKEQNTRFSPIMVD